MKSTSRNRLIAASIGAVLVCLLLIFGRPYLFPTVMIGDFTMPKLQGWQQKVTRSGTTHRINYVKNESGNRLYIGFIWKLDRATTIPKTEKDLQLETANALGASAGVSQSLGAQMQPTVPQPISFNGMMAVGFQNIMKSSSTVSYGKYINFINKNHYYNISSTITVPAPSTSCPPQLQAEMDKALETINKALSTSSS